MYNGTPTSVCDTTVGSGVIIPATMKMIKKAYFRFDANTSCVTTPNLANTAMTSGNWNTTPNMNNMENTKDNVWSNPKRGVDILYEKAKKNFNVMGNITKYAKEAPAKKRAIVGINATIIIFLSFLVRPGETNAHNSYMMIGEEMITPA